jgi:hypothetical protein
MKTDFDISSSQITYLVIPEKHGQRMRPCYVLLVGWAHGALPFWFGKHTVRGFHDSLTGPAYQTYFFSIYYWSFNTSYLQVDIDLYEIEPFKLL